jgi:ribosomal protein S18 acetylase RimI-like enzyme
MEIHIRRGRRTDYAVLAALCSWPATGGPSPRLFRRAIADLGYDLYVAEEGGRAIGVVAVSYVRTLALGGQRATLEELFVDPAKRRAGIGRHLAEFAIGRARRRGARVFEARSADDDGGRFLERVGFRACGTRYVRALEEAPQ